MSVDLLSEQALLDPYPFYARLRDDTPVCRWRLPNGLETWQVTRYEDARLVLADRRFSHAEEALRGAGVFLGGDAAFGPSMMTSDPPDHTRLRRLVTRAFTPRRVEELRPRVQQIVDRLLDAMARGHEADLISAFAFPLPVTVICELLGVPPEDQDDLRAWTRTMVIIPATEQERERLRDGAQALQQYLGRLVARKQAAVRADLPDQAQPDLLSALITARDEGGRLSERELIGTMNLLLFAGHETTANLIGNGMLALFRHPDQLRMLRERPELLPSAIEEFLRYEGPSQRGTFRVAVEDVDVAGVTIPAGSVVMVMIGSADRDPRQFADPDRLDITRGGSDHVAFGHGIHYCLGAPLARMEGQVAFGTLLSRFPDLALACAPDEVRRGPRSIFVRGVVALPVRFTPGSSS
jgi:cytochrome P450